MFTLNSDKPGDIGAFRYQFAEKVASDGPSPVHFAVELVDLDVLRISVKKIQVTDLPKDVKFFGPSSV